ncbi:hypothetical protein GOODEAATRI_013161 [Goodea atripinnis]|uniref:Uncharacterized protein n=1 Tax=Goodea atripinnis TaxID=208336 RepID=A0ABV0NDJ7_9TELE
METCQDLQESPSAHYVTLACTAKDQDLPGQKECVPCPAGFHCQPLNPTPTRGTSLGVSSPLPCPAGYICPRDSLDNQPIPCPKGTYSSSQGLISTGQCLMCPAAGFFCPSGTRVPLACPAGTFSSEMGNTHQDNCTICIPGYYCQDEGTLQPVLCPVGHYCPAGQILEQEFPCPPGTVQSRLGASSPNACSPCSAGEGNFVHLHHTTMHFWTVLLCRPSW